MLLPAAYLPRRRGTAVEDQVGGDGEKRRQHVSASDYRAHRLTVHLYEQPHSHTLALAISGCDVCANLTKQLFKDLQANRMQGEE